MASAHQIRDLITQTTTGTARPRVPREVRDEVCRYAARRRPTQSAARPSISKAAVEGSGMGVVMMRAWSMPSSANNVKEADSRPGSIVTESVPGRVSKARVAKPTGYVAPGSPTTASANSI